MTEQEWLASNDVAAMLAAVADWNRMGRKPQHGSRVLVSDRKLRLFACACCRLVRGHLADARGRRAVETAEAFADGAATGEELVAADQAADAAAFGQNSPGAWAAAWVAHQAVTPDETSSVLSYTAAAGLPPAAQAALLREVVGSPFRPVAVNPAWLTPTVLALAAAAYSEPRRVGCGRCKGRGYVGDLANGPGPYACPDCSGTGTATDGLLDAERLGVLADALEDAGCDDAAILNHLRFERCPDCDGRGRWRDGGAEIVCCRCHGTGGNGPHARGCWGLDLILGKE